MSGGKKRSGFQITSVTSDYNQPSESPPPAPTGCQLAPAPQPVLLSVLPDPSLLEGSNSHPTTPRPLRKYSSQDGSASPQGSRFRVVRLDQARGDPYRRGRWTCTDFMEWEEGAGLQGAGLRRVMGDIRHAHSLESLELEGLRGAEGGGARLGPHSHVRALRAGHHVSSQGTMHLLAQPMPGEGGGFMGSKPLLLHSGPPSPTHQDRLNVRLLDQAPPQSPHRLLDQAPPLSPRPRNPPPPLRLDVDASGRSHLRVSRSQPSSPGGSQTNLFQGGLSPVHTPSAFSHTPSAFGLPPLTPSAYSIAQSMLSAGGAFSLMTDDGGSSNSLIAIDNKIEQAMDLVKTHLMLAVREEVELLREQIRELTERNAQLERENYILRALGGRI